MAGNIWAYDIEVYRNFFSLTAIRIGEPGEPEDIRYFVTYGARDDRKELGKWIRETRPELVGFNCYEFDDLILSGVLLAPGKGIEAVWELAQKLIDRRQSGEIKSIQLLRSARDKIKSIDLMLLLGNNYNSLKEVEAKLGLSIQELPFPWDSHIAPDQILDLLEYNAHDVRATIALYRRLLPVIETRRAIGDQFSIHALSSTDSTLANEILDRLYKRPAGATGTPRDSVIVGDIISSRVQFVSPELSAFLEELRAVTLISANGFSISKALEFGGVRYKFGGGGIHSEDGPGKFAAAEGSILRDADVTSYYPAIMLNLGVFPAHLGPPFLEFYSGLVKKRIEAKEKGDRITADSLKIAINSVFGKLGYEYSWLYDPRAFLTVTINGQLFLLDLIEKLSGAGITIVSANTDGILSHIPAGLEEAYSSICSAWQERTGFSLEYTDYSRFIRKDVNNYLAEEVGGKIKAKGAFVEKKPLGDSYRHPIVPRAIREFFLNGTDPGETIARSRDIMDFAFVFKPGGKFAMVYEEPGRDPEPVGRVNRFYISKSGGSLIKVSSNRRDKVRNNPVRLINGELPEELPADLDLGFYESEALKIINQIDRGRGPGQLALALEPEGPTGEGGIDGLDGLRDYLKDNPGEAGEANGSPSGLLESSYSLIEITDAMKAFPEGDSFRAICPVHEGKDGRSLKITEKDGGKLDLYCFAGCKPGEILEEIERRIGSGETFRKPNNEGLGEIVAIYEYKDELGRVQFRKVRYEPKDFRVQSWEPREGEFRMGLNGKRAVLYRLPDVLSSKGVIIVEGEKDADNGADLELEDWVFTCNFDGAGNWKSSYSRALAHRDVIIIPDNDPPGRDHADQIVSDILPYARSVRVLTLPAGKDLSDWIALGNGPEELLALIEKAESKKAGDIVNESDLIKGGAGDPGNSAAFLALYGDRVAFTGGFGPLFYEGGYWHMGPEAEALMNQKIIEALFRRMEAAKKADSKDRDLEKLAKASFPSDSRVTSTRKFAKNWKTVSEDRFQSPPGLLNVRNGVIDLRTGELYPAHPSYGFTYRIDLDYRPGRSSKLWNDFLKQTIPDEEERDYIQELMGYVFTGETKEELVIYISGPTRSGKGTLTETLQAVGGPLAAEINIATLLEKRSSNDQNFDLAGLYQARFVHGSESSSSDYLDSRKLKALSGGNTIRAAFKGRDLFQYRPQFTVIITSNESPKMKAEDTAAWERLKALEFPISKLGGENKNLKGMLREPGNLEGVLTWLVEGAVRWYSKLEIGGLREPLTVRERTAGFREALDYIMEFAQDHYEIAEDVSNWSRLVEEGFYVPIDTAYSHYKVWHDENGQPELKKINFARKLRERLGGVNMFENTCRISIPDPITGKGKQTRVIAGIKLKEDSGEGGKPISPIDLGGY